MNEIIKAYKKLYRSRREKAIAGVCGGLGQYFNVDPVIIRLLFIVLFFLGGSTLFAYMIMWIVVPLEPQ